MLSDIRVGKFTSSNIWKLMTKGRGAAPSKTRTTYIEEVSMEGRLKRALSNEMFSRSVSWGKLVEKRVASLLAQKNAFEYKYDSEKTIVHPDIDYWVGTPDLIAANKVGDIKCPYTLKSFIQLVDIMSIADLEALKKDFPEYYWQLVSNAVLTNKQTAELIVYCPYRDELEQIRDLACESGESDYAWIEGASDFEMPFLIAAGEYKNLNRFEFEVDKVDKNELATQVRQAVMELKEAKNDKKQG